MLPTYSYQCQKCLGTFEIFQSMNEDSFEKYKCSQCNKKTKVKRLIVGGSGMIFKGSGFYLTDYTNYGKADKTEKPIESIDTKKEKRNNSR